MLGPAFLVAIFALFKVNVLIPPKFRNPFIGILGVWLGGSFDSSILDNVETWFLTLLLLALYIPFAFYLTFLVLHKIRKLKNQNLFLLPHQVDFLKWS